MAVGGRVSRRLSPSRNGPAGAARLGRVRPAIARDPFGIHLMPRRPVLVTSRGGRVAVSLNQSQLFGR
jgi:hypothetical protein